MITLSTLKNTTRKKQKVQRVGRGASSGRGKTSSRGHKGQGSRSGARRRYGKEGGNVPLFRKLPHRGFTRGRFLENYAVVNLFLIDKLFSDGDVVNEKSLKEKGLVPKNIPGGIKVLAKGDINKKVTIEAKSFSDAAIKKLEAKNISYKILKK